MKLNEKGFALSAAATMTIAYIVCTIFVAFFPALAMKFFGWMVHLVNIDANVRVTFGNFIGGLLPLVFYSYAGSWVFAHIYNRTVKA